MINKKILFFFGAVFLSDFAHAAGDIGKINYLSLASNVAKTVRPGTVQFSIVGGFLKAPTGCNKDYAAVSGEDQHLISLLLMAKAQEKEIEVHLDSTNKYYSDRCLVSYIEYGKEN